MSNLADTLRSEISRPARKEIPAEMALLRKAVVQQRAHIATLRRHVDALECIVKRAARSVGTRARTSEGSLGDEQLRFRAGGLVSHRKRLGLSASDFGRLLGVSGQSIYKWEAGEVTPRRTQLEAIAAVRMMGKREAAARLAALSASEVS